MVAFDVGVPTKQHSKAIPLLPINVIIENESRNRMSWRKDTAMN